jgi:hypothetical protein
MKFLTTTASIISACSAAPKLLDYTGYYQLNSVYSNDKIGSEFNILDLLNLNVDRTLNTILANQNRPQGTLSAILNGKRI